MKRYWLPALGALALAGALFASHPGITAPARGQGDTEIAVGYVDVQKVLQDSPAAINARKDAEALKSQLQDRLAQQSDLLYLTEAEQNELTTLLDKPQPSDKDKQRIAELRKRSHDAEQELRDLEQKSNLTDAEKSRHADLLNLQRQNAANLQTEQQKDQEKLDKLAGDLMDNLQNRILKVVEEVAGQEKLSMVVDKQARLYGGRDITDQVLAKLKS